VTVTKAQAAELIRLYGLEGLPALLARTPAQLEHAVRALGPDVTRYVLRTSGHDEELNLPRIVDIGYGPAEAWFRAHESPAGILVQPYEELEHSAELAFGETGPIIMELVRGPWELDLEDRPLSLRFDEPEPGALRVVADLEPSPPTSTTGAAAREIGEWVGEHLAALRRLAHDLDATITMKLHVYRQSRVSPQNIRTLPARPHSTSSGPVAAQGAIPPPLVLREIGTHIPPGTRAVVLAVSIPRDEAHQISRLAARLHEQGVTDVYISTGLLGHLAIMLRGAGLEVHSARPPSD